MYLASNQVNDKAGPSLDVIDERRHNQDNATKGVYVDGQLSNPCLDTPNEHSTSWQPKNCRTEACFSYSTEMGETRNMQQDIPTSTHEPLQEKHWRKAIEEELHSSN